MRKMRPGWLKRKSKPSGVRTSHGSASPAAAPGNGQTVTLPVLLITFSKVLPSKYQLPSESCRSDFSPAATSAGAVVGCVEGLVDGLVAGTSSLKSSGGGTSSGAANILSVFSSSARQS